VLYDACVADMHAQVAPLMAESAALIADAPDPATAIDRVVRRGFRFALAHRVAVRLLLRSALEGQGLDERYRDAYLLPSIDLASRYLSPLVSRPADELRFAVQSSIFLIVRYAASSEEDIRLIHSSGGDETASDRTAAAMDALETHLAETVARMLRA
jgi:hypothetical protein